MHVKYAGQTTQLIKVFLTSIALPSLINICSATTSENLTKINSSVPSLCGAGFITDYAIDEPFGPSTLTTKIKLATTGFPQPTGKTFGSWIDGSDAGQVITIATYDGNYPQAWEQQARILSTIQHAMEMRFPVKIYTTNGSNCAQYTASSTTIRVCSDVTACGGQNAPPPGNATRR